MMERLPQRKTESAGVNPGMSLLLTHPWYVTGVPRINDLDDRRVFERQPAILVSQGTGRNSAALEVSARITYPHLRSSKRSIDFNGRTYDRRIASGATKRSIRVYFHAATVSWRIIVFRSHVCGPPSLLHARTGRRSWRVIRAYLKRRLLDKASHRSERSVKGCTQRFLNPSKGYQ